jgi:hypothetical protein
MNGLLFLFKVIKITIILNKLFIRPKSTKRLNFFSIKKSKHPICQEGYYWIFTKPYNSKAPHVDKKVCNQVIDIK